MASMETKAHEAEMVKRYMTADRIQKSLGINLQRGGCKKNSGMVRARRRMDCNAAGVVYHNYIV